MQLQRAARLGIALFAFFCSTAWAQTSTLEVSPVQPEAYQPFTITTPPYFSLYPSNLGVLGFSVEAGVITLELALGESLIIPPSSSISTKSISVTGLPAGTYSIYSKDLLSGLTGLLGQLTVSRSPPSLPVYALYHPDINHYFLTASTAQRDFLLQGNLGWIIVDDGFKAWPANGPAPAAAKPVCRLYSPVVNTHFFSADAASCDSLKQQTGTWIDEGIAFRALVPTAGTCPSGTLPVWRLYNNRFAQLDSNHRYVTSQDTYRHMIANGWIGEGARFCSPE